MNRFQPVLLDVILPGWYVGMLLAGMVLAVVVVEWFAAHQILRASFRKNVGPISTERVVLGVIVANVLSTGLVLPLAGLAREATRNHPVLVWSVALVATVLIELWPCLWIWRGIRWQLSLLAVLAMNVLSYVLLGVVRSC